jgi:methylenetetrahydrofolate reductase (NADPH)
VDGCPTDNKSIEIANNVQNLFGIECQLHITCSSIAKSELIDEIEIAKRNGIQNILALTGDPPLEEFIESKKSHNEHFCKYAVDLVKLIRQEYGDHFGVCVAGYPEGHPYGSYEQDLKHLKEKVDAGADFVITQLFYDCDQYLNFVKNANKMGIHVPIVPGIMPIQSYGRWKRISQFCKIKVPDSIIKDLENINKEDDNEVRAYGIKLCIDMCKYLMNAGVRGFHFYTLNLEKSVSKILEGLELVQENVPRPLPCTCYTFYKRKCTSYLLVISTKKLHCTHKILGRISKWRIWSKQFSCIWRII